MCGGCILLPHTLLFEIIFLHWIGETIEYQSKCDDFYLSRILGYK